MTKEIYYDLKNLWFFLVRAHYRELKKTYPTVDAFYKATQIADKAIWDRGARIPLAIHHVANMLYVFNATKGHWGGDALCSLYRERSPDGSFQKRTVRFRLSLPK